MKFQKIFTKQAQEQQADFKKADETNTFLTKEETDKILKQALYAKIGQINNVNYLKHINTDPIYLVPDFENLLKSLTEHLTNDLGWSIDDFNFEAIETLCYYFSRHPKFETLKPGYSLKKGIAFFGPIGSGKTKLLEMFQRNNFNPYRKISCREIANDYAENGEAIIKKYTLVTQVNKHEWLGHSTVGYLFDDLGTEDITKNYGNKKNVMSEIILNRYDYNEDKNITHFTTNLTIDEIRGFYGDRATSRMREMMNIIEIPFNSPDRRR